MFDNVIGKVITAWNISEGQQIIRIDFSDYYSHYIEVGNWFCNRTWWSDILGAKSSIGGTVLSWESLPLPERYKVHRPTRRYKDYFGKDKTWNELRYGFSVHTSNGDITLAFRNEGEVGYGGDAYVIHPDDIGKRHYRMGWDEIDTDDWRY